MCLLPVLSGMLRGIDRSGSTRTSTVTVRLPAAVRGSGRCSAGRPVIARSGRMTFEPRRGRSVGEAGQARGAEEATGSSVVRGMRTAGTSTAAGRRDGSTIQRRGRSPRRSGGEAIYYDIQREQTSSSFESIDTRVRPLACDTNGGTLITGIAREPRVCPRRRRSRRTRPPTTSRASRPRRVSSPTPAATPNVP